MASDYRRVALAIEYLTERRRDPPSLAEVAAEVGLSTFHFQRLFRRMTGVSPKRFCQALSGEVLAARLHAGESALSAALGAGLTSASRGHELMVALRAMTPGEYREAGAGEYREAGAALTLRYGAHVTPWGACWVAQTARGICELQFVDEASADEGGADKADVERGSVDAAIVGGADSEGVREDDVLEKCAERQARAYLAQRWPNASLVHAPEDTAKVAEALFDASRRTGPLSLHVRGTNFQLRVWNALLSIPEGAATSYGSVARLIGSPSAARAVGSAIAKNPVALLIPCHRVLRACGAVGEYRWGGARKRSLLAWEFAQLDAYPRLRKRGLETG